MSAQPSPFMEPARIQVLDDMYNEDAAIKSLMAVLVRDIHTTEREKERKKERKRRTDRQTGRRRERDKEAERGRRCFSFVRWWKRVAWAVVALSGQSKPELSLTFCVQRVSTTNVVSTALSG